VSRPPHDARRTWGFAAAALVGLFGLALLVWTGGERPAVDGHADTTFETTLEAPAVALGASLDEPSCHTPFDAGAFEAAAFEAGAFGGSALDAGDSTLSDPTLPG
jgi:hypothetical protein